MKVVEGQWGDGPKWLMRKWGDPPFRAAVIHGGPGAPGSAAPVACELSRDVGVLEPFQQSDSIEGEVEELGAQLKAEADLPVIVIGHSWGAWLTWIFAARHPEMVSKLILVGSGPFEAHYAESIIATRMSRVPAKDHDEVRSLISDLERPDVSDKDQLASRLNDLMSKADHFDPIHLDPTIPDCGLGFLGVVHAKVWAEAQELRCSGRLLDIAKHIRCPVVAIHGDHDPHPAEGVEKPLSSVLRESRFILLERCGHEPWRERYARDEFFRVLERELRP